MNLNINNFRNLIFLYLIFKTISLILLIYLLPIIFNKTYFYSNDFYNLYNKCQILGPNFLFSFIVCHLDIHTLEDPVAIFVSIILSLFKDYLFFLIAKKFLTQKYLILFVLLIASHPYLNLYFMKFSNDIFNNLGISIYFFLTFTNKVNHKLSFLIFFILSLLRNSLVFILTVHYLYNIYLFIKKKKIIKNINLIYKNVIMIFIILIPVILVNLNYLDDFLSSNNIYDLNINFFLNKLNFLPLGIDYLFSSILNILTHLVLLLSFREQAYTEFLLFFSNNNSYLIIYLVMGIVFFLYHFFGFFYFINTKF